MSDEMRSLTPKERAALKKVYAGSSKSSEPTITLSEHAAQLQAACVEFKNKAMEAIDCRPGRYSSDVDAIRLIPIPTAALETALDKTQTETITACACAVCEGCKNGWLLSHGSHQTPQQGRWFPCKADAILALSPVKVAAALETAIAKARLEVAVEISERSVHGMIPDVFEMWLDDYVEEKKAALDAAKAKVNDAPR